jgi:EAL domain-containing protein (putative c-di-GMP-specific phosphodiesterase class I)
MTTSAWPPARRRPREDSSLKRRMTGKRCGSRSQPLSLAGQTLVMQASIGIVANVPTGLSAQAVLLQADTALRRAKIEGRNRYVLHEPRLDAAVQERSQIELELANAPANGQMHLVYQPYIDLATGQATGVEALMRWNHPERGKILPNTFIPLAEATGLILPLGTWALRTACQQATAWPSHLVLSVNISALQFHQPSFTAQVDAALAESGFPPERLELEITETVLMRDNPETIAQIEALIDRGIRIALDDFGTGYSALAYLARLPHHRIKLDHTFVQDLANPATAELIRAIIALAVSNGVSITAEGIERPEQLAQVKAMGFTHAQGFAMGLPAADPAAQLAELCDAPFA